jgi:glutaminase
MIDRVAKAIYAKIGVSPGMADFAARTAIEAMRKPTTEMVAAGLAAISDVTVSEPKATAWDALRFHRAMIDAALAE